MNDGVPGDWADVPMLRHPDGWSEGKAAEREDVRALVEAIRHARTVAQRLLDRSEGDMESNTVRRILAYRCEATLEMLNGIETAWVSRMEREQRMGERAA